MRMHRDALPPIGFIAHWFEVRLLSRSNMQVALVQAFA